MKKLIFCLGTRPEAIKMAPLILEAQKRKQEVKVLVTGQHKEMLLPFLKFFNLKVDFNLDVLKPNQSLPELTATILRQVSPILQAEKPDLVFVQGDTTTTMASALAAFYEKIPLVHIEAGLRTFDRYSPFPEEMNRKLVGSIAEYHFPPTKESEQNLFREGITKNVSVTGNTGVDALRITLERLGKDSSTIKPFSEGKKQVLMTCHRRENHGKPLESICSALLEVVDNNRHVNVVFPVHLNPNVQNMVRSKLGNHERIRLIDPQGYQEFSELMFESDLILTDSGGVQEEAPYLKKPIFVLRESTERSEGVSAGVAMLVGSDHQKIVSTLERALYNREFYESFQKAVNPYGDGYSSQRILDHLGVTHTEYVPETVTSFASIFEAQFGNESLL